MACLRVKLCVAISERFRKRIWYLKALYECSGLLTLLAVLYAYALNIRRAVKKLDDMFSRFRMAH